MVLSFTTATRSTASHDDAAFGEAPDDRGGPAAEHEAAELGRHRAGPRGATQAIRSA